MPYWHPDFRMWVRHKIGTTAVTAGNKKPSCPERTAMCLRYPLLYLGPELFPSGCTVGWGACREVRCEDVCGQKGGNPPQVALVSDFVTPEARGSTETDTLRRSVTPGYYIL